MSLIAQIKHRGEQQVFSASIMVTMFLAATQRLDNLKKMTYKTIDKVRKMRNRGKQIFCTNRVRMCILRQMWNDQQSKLIEQLNQVQSRRTSSQKQGMKRLTSTYGMSPLQAKRYEETKKNLGLLISLNDEVRDVALKRYFKLCKERSAQAFIEWRMEQKKIQEDNPCMKKALRLRRLINRTQCERKEVKMFEIYKSHEHDFESYKDQLIKLELEI